MKIKAINHYLKALMLVAQVSDISSPNVVVQPMDPLLDKAIKIIKQKEPNAFSGVSTINVGTGSGSLGFVESGPGKDPTVVNIDAGLIKNKASQFDPNTADFLNGLPNPEEAKKVFWTTVTLYHEIAHVKDFDEKSGFPGGEGVAESAERDIINWMKSNISSIQYLFQ